MGTSEIFEAGLAVRKSVMGAEYVEKSLASADQLTFPLQALVTEYAWGTVWARPGRPRSTRSLLNVGMLIALNRPHELKQHILGAFRNGCSKEEVVEVILQAAIYCGCPAALDAMRLAQT